MVELGVGIFGWGATISFTICGIPQALQSYRQGHSREMNKYFLVFWGLGYILGLIYAYGLNAPLVERLPMFASYILGAMVLLVIVRYKIWERYDSPN